MIVERVILLIGLIISICTCFVSLIDTDKCRRLLFLLWGLTTTTILLNLSLLLFHQINSNFKYEYVYKHTCIELPLIYKISALWSGQEGSFLLWSVILCLIGFFVINIGNNSSQKVFTIYVFICSSIIYMTYRSNPFRVMENVSLNGVGLNEALKSPWMVIHPPLVFIGYTTMAVLFSLAVNNKSISNYIIKRWIYLSVIFLGLGIFTGSIWAYKELGWGGYWSWDPIENSALVPWIILCAYLHDKKHIGRLKCIIPFLLAVFGTFLTRSGILKNKSVHSYITASSNVNIVILIGFVFIGVIIVSIIIKNIVRERSLNSSIMSYFKVISYIYAGSIFIGTILPLFVNIHIKITYYNIVSIVYIVLVSLIMIIYYKNIVASKYIITLMANTLLTVSIIFIYATYDLKWLVICFICLMPITLLVISFITYRNNRDIKYYIIHLGVFLLIIGAITSSALGKKEISMCEIKTNNVSVEDHKVPILKLMKEKMVITNNIKEDTIICYSGISIDRSTIFITEKTKPLIILFWGGGYLIIVGAIISLYKYRKS